MGPRLEPREIEALLDTVEPKSTAQDQPMGNILSYDLCNPLRFKSAEIVQIRTIFDRVLERFLEILRGVLDLEITAELIELGQISRAERDANADESSYVSQFVTPHTEVPGAVVFDQLLFGATVERLMGGRGDIVEDFVHTPISGRVADYLVSDLLLIINEMFRPIVDFGAKLPSEEDVERLDDRIASGNEAFLRAVVGIREERWAGELWILVPTAVLEGVLEAPRESSSEAPSDSAAGLIEAQSTRVEGILRTMSRTMVEVSAAIGPGEVTGNELLKMSPGDVILLGRPVGSAVEISVEGCPRFLAKLGRQGRQVVVQILGVLQDE